MSKNQVCLFFYVNGTFLVHGCSLAEAENYGDFLVYPDSHFEIWDKHYAKRYPVDFDFFPRGRVAYCKRTQTFQILHDRCIDKEVREFSAEYYVGTVSLGHDEHYQCHKCNLTYVL